MDNKAAFAIMMIIIIIVLILLMFFIGYVGYKEAWSINANCDYGFSKFCWKWSKIVQIK